VFPAVNPLILDREIIKNGSRRRTQTSPPAASGFLNPIYCLTPEQQKNPNQTPNHKIK
jgi:hypothetical protein